jgi:hypothetical protein
LEDSNARQIEVLAMVRQQKEEGSMGWGYWSSFVALAGLALLAFYLVFQLRYYWFVSRPVFDALNEVLLAFVVVAIAGWIWFPSRLLLCIATFAFLICPALFIKHRIGDLDLIFALMMTPVILLVYLATWFRQKSWRLDR